MFRYKWAIRLLEVPRRRRLFQVQRILISMIKEYVDPAANGIAAFIKAPGLGDWMRNGFFDI